MKNYLHTKWSGLWQILSGMFVAISLMTSASASTPTASLLLVEQVEFAPTAKQIFRIPYRTSEQAKAKIELFTSDGDLVRTIENLEFLDPGDHSFEWDGKDSDGVIVPNETYVPVLTTVFKNHTVVTDPRTETGGEVIDKIPVRVVNDTDIQYTLPAPARVLVRVGKGGGAMLRDLANWSPRTAGSNIQRWDGYDKNKVARLAGDASTKILVTAFRLPEHSIIVSGNNPLDYAVYRKQNQWPVREIAVKDMALQRNGIRIARSYYLPRSYSKDPDVSMDIVEPVKRNSSGEAIVTGPVTLRVNVAKDDRWLLSNSLFEVAFFIDFEFISEEESGYVPLSWRWDPAGLEPGRHIVTVNISGFLGQVGVRSFAVEIPEK